MSVTEDTLFEALEHTWPAAEVFNKITHRPWTLRRGLGGGKRVSAATPLRDSITISDIRFAEAMMQDMGQTPLFMIRNETDLDRTLDQNGYQIVDPVNMYACPIETLSPIDIPPVTAFTIWEPLAIMRDIWAAGGIGPTRLAVMERCTVAKTGILGRLNDSPGGTGFTAVHNNTAMVHALEVLPDQRGQGMGRFMMAKAAQWATTIGATHMAVACTVANAPANALYANLGMTIKARYHYRMKEPKT